MKKIVTFIVASTALFGAQIAHATTYTAGTHTFSGPVIVEKDSGPFPCTLNVTVTATTSSATASASLSGGFPCGFIGVVGAPYPVSFDPVTKILTIGGGSNLVRINPPLSLGYCEGTLKAQWDGNGPPTPRSITVSSPLSDIQWQSAGVDCKLDGTIVQTSSPALNIN